ncbi:MAG TPA: hypothetical protein VHU19_14110 [Pyrinomonadaceae bacterium]|jgi:hypothetical protein|nr:hypothetical protein [Pyrinomonadaceae bacterium]
MGGNNGRQEQDALQRQAQAAQAAQTAAVTKAETPDPLTQRLRDRVGKILDWQDDTSGPKDVRAFPDQAAMSLYTGAKAVTDAGRVGKGYGTLAEGANPAFATALNKENDLKRGEAASGMLEGYVDNALTGATGEAASLGAQGDATSMAIAQMLNSDSESAQNRYLQYLTRPKQPSFLKQMALGLAGSAAGLATGGLSSIFSRGPASLPTWGTQSGSPWTM